MLTIVYKIGVIFAMIAVGLLTNKLGLLPSAANKYLIPLLMQITSPAMVLRAISSVEMSGELINSTIAVMLGSLLYYVLSCILGTLVVRKSFLGKNTRDAGVYICLLNLVNNGFMGMPITLSLFGEHYLYLMVLANIVMIVWVYSGGILQLHLGGSASASKGLGKGSLKAMINPSTMSSVLGIAMLFLGLHFPPFIMDVIDPFADMCVPLSMLVVGVQLGQSDLKSLFFRKDLAFTTLIKLVLVPAMVLAAVHFLPVGSDAKLTLVLSAAFPVAVVATGIAAQENMNATLASEGAAHSTAFSIITLPVCAYMLSSLYL